MKFIYALAAAAAFGLAACSQAETDQAEQDMENAAAETGQALENAGDQIAAGANEAGEAVEGAVNDAATEVEHATDDDPKTN
ncbi:MAG: hypothetical protein AB7O98_02115 [Hyphomonadaceae bacterium]